MPLTALADELQRIILLTLDRRNALAGSGVCHSWHAVLRSNEVWQPFCAAMWPSASALPCTDWFMFGLKRLRSLWKDAEERERSLHVWLGDCHLLVELQRGEQQISLALRLSEASAWGDHPEHPYQDLAPYFLHRYATRLEWEVPSLAFDAAVGCAATYVKTCHLWRASTNECLLLASDGADGRRPLMGRPHTDMRLHPSLPNDGSFPYHTTPTLFELLPRELEDSEEFQEDSEVCTTYKNDVVVRFQKIRSSVQIDHALFGLGMDLSVDFEDLEDESVLRSVPLLELSFRSLRQSDIGQPPGPSETISILDHLISDWPRWLSILEWT